jgi:hypothetical protein
MPRQFSPGDQVIYRKQKHSTHPGPRATGIHPAPHGEDYSYQVNKFWIVVDAEPDAEVIVRTRRGKEHIIAIDDPALRKARWWERFVFGSRFPTLDGS